MGSSLYWGMLTGERARRSRHTEAGLSRGACRRHLCLSQAGRLEGHGKHALLSVGDPLKVIN